MAGSNGSVDPSCDVGCSRFSPKTGIIRHAAGACNHGRESRDTLPGPPCSEDRTQSPDAVSQKWEYFGMWPEILAISPRRRRNREAGDGSLNWKSPPLAGLSTSIRDIFSERQTAWLGRDLSHMGIFQRLFNALARCEKTRYRQKYRQFLVQLYRFNFRKLPSLGYGRFPQLPLVPVWSALSDAACSCEDRPRG